MKIQYRAYKKSLAAMEAKKKALEEELVASYSDKFKESLGDYIVDLFHPDDIPPNSAVKEIIRALILGEFNFFFDKNDIEGLTLDDVKVIARYEITRPIGEYIEH